MAGYAALQTVLAIFSAACLVVTIIAGQRSISRAEEAAARARSLLRKQPESAAGTPRPETRPRGRHRLSEQQNSWP